MDTPGAQSGGNVFPQDTLEKKNNYDRKMVVHQASKSPGLFSQFILPASRKIASGAGTLISTVFGSDAAPTSSGGDYSYSDDDVESSNAATNYSHSESMWSNEDNGIQSEKINSFIDQPQSVLGDSEVKQLIEQLIMQQNFSREECDRLIETIKLRVVDISTDGESKLLNTSTKAVLEAKKWLAGKLSGSKSGFGSSFGKTTTLSKVTDSAHTSPVDMAKFYMQAKPSWVSPSIDIEFSKTPIPMRPVLEETPQPVHCSSLSSSKMNGYSSTSGLWNLNDEVRRVRSKANDDLLKSPLSLLKDDKSRDILGAEAAGDLSQRDALQPLPISTYNEENQNAESSKRRKESENALFETLNLSSKPFEGTRSREMTTLNISEAACRLPSPVRSSPCGVMEARSEEKMESCKLLCECSVDFPNGGLATEAEELARKEERGKPKRKTMNTKTDMRKRSKNK